MGKKTSFGSHNFIEVEDLKNHRFNFIKNEILRENIAIKMQYIMFLISLEDKYVLPGAVTYSTFKTIISYTGAIIESLIHYKIDEMLKNKEINPYKVLKKEDKYKDWKTLYEISDSEKLCSVRKVQKIKSLRKNTSFSDLNRIAKRAKIFDHELFEYAEEIRELRNKMHPYTLLEIDDKYSKEDINNVFFKAAQIIQRIEIF